MGKKIAEKDALAGLKHFLAAPEQVDNSTKIMVARYLLKLIESQYPGYAVELRIPLAGAVQILSGVRHRRGTPPAVVEIAMEDWINLAVGVKRWQELKAQSRIHSSGERSNLSEFFPLSLPVEIK